MHECTPFSRGSCQPALDGSHPLKKRAMTNNTEAGQVDPHGMLPAAVPVRQRAASAGPAESPRCQLQLRFADTAVAGPGPSSRNSTSPGEVFPARRPPPPFLGGGSAALGRTSSATPTHCPEGDNGCADPDDPNSQQKPCARTGSACLGRDVQAPVSQARGLDVGPKERVRPLLGRSDRRPGRFQRNRDALSASDPGHKLPQQLERRRLIHERRCRERATGPTEQAGET